MYNPVIHIGYPKTGTTWFSESYYSKIKNINFLPPELFLTQITEPCFKAPKSDNNMRLVILHPELTGVRRFIWDKGIQRNIIANSLKKHFPDATIIIFLRNQLDFLTSAYIYYVRKGGTYTPVTILDMIIKGELNFTLDYLKYNETIELYESIFGKNNVHVYLFEDFYCDTVTFITDYSKRYNFDIEIEHINFSPVNEKLCYRLMSYMRISNYFTKADTPFKTYYINCNWIYRNINMKYNKFNKWKIFGNKPETTNLFRPDQILYVNDYFRASNKELQKNFMLADILKYNYPL